MSQSSPIQPYHDPISLSDRKRSLLGLRVDDWVMTELIQFLDKCIINREPIHLWGINVPTFAMARTIPEVVDFSQKFDVVTADGAGIPIFGRFMGQKIRAHVGVPHVSEELIELAERKGYRVLLFGATPEVNAEAGRRMKEKYPLLNLCPGIDGYYAREAEEEVATKIRDLKPDILLVGMSVPRKEKFLLAWKDFMQVPVGVGCGGYIDVLAGKTSLAPKVIERMAMSWLWRFILEPRRLFSKMLVGGLLFIFYIFPVAVLSHLFFPKHPLDIFDLFPGTKNKRATI